MSIRSAIVLRLAMRRMQRCLGVLLLCMLGACDTAPTERTSTAGGPTITPDVVYGHKSGMALTMDVYQAERPGGAAVIFFMSGGWRSLPEWKQWVAAPDGIRLETDAELHERLPVIRSFGFRPLLERGVTVFAVRHGSSPTFRMPEIVADLRASLRFIRQHAPEYGVDPDRLGLWGLSAGGHLALLLATTVDREAGGPPESPTSPSGVSAVVALSAPTDLQRAIRGPEPTNPALDLSDLEYQQFSPYRHVSAQVPPTLFVHGENDGLVPLVESRSMHEALRSHGVETRLVTIPGAGHGFEGEAAELALDEAIRWFEQHLDVR